MIKSVYGTSATDVHEGDVYIVTVTFHVIYESANGHPMVKAYRCLDPNDISDDGVPQGNPIDPDDCKKLMGALAPVLTWAGAKAA